MGDEDGLVECDAAVRRGHRHHAGAARPERQHQLPVGLDHRDHAGDRQLLDHGRRPGAAAVVGALHGELVEAVADQRVGQVAAPPERARRAVVAGEPVLVVGELIGLRQRRVDRRAPGQPGARAVDRQPIDAGCERKRVREPDSVGGVVGEHGVACAGGRPGRLRHRGQTGENPLPPGAAAVLRGREADARRAAVPVPTDLEEGDRRRADRLRVGLDLRFVLAVRVREAVAMDPAADDLAARSNEVAQVGGDDVEAGAAGDVVAAVVVLDGDPVVTRARVDPVRAFAPEQHVRTRRPDECRARGGGRDCRQRHEQKDDRDATPHDRTVAARVHSGE